MLDFNTKRRILKKLSDTAERNVLLLLPCLIAAGFVKLFYFIVCSVDLALSDKEGNFLGIKKEHTEKQRRTRKDDIVYVKRGFVPRAVSLVLSFAFAMMFVPTAFPSISSFAAENWDQWDYRSTEYSKFVVIDDPQVVYDVNMPFDRFIAPKINQISEISGTSCTIEWNKDEYVSSGASALPVMFRPGGQNQNKDLADGILKGIEVCAYKKINGKTTFEKIDTADTWAGTELTTGTQFENLSPTIEVINLDPDAEYMFFLNATQQWIGYAKDENFVDAYEYDVVGEDKIVKGNYPDGSTRAKATYPAIKNDHVLPDGTHTEQTLVDGAADVDMYYCGSYSTNTDEATGVTTATFNNRNKSAQTLSMQKKTIIPHYSNGESIPARRLADVKTFAEYKPADETNPDDFVNVFLGEPVPENENVYGYLVYRGIPDANGDVDFALIKKVYVPVSGSFENNLVYVDKGVEMTTNYTYYLCPITWDKNAHSGDFLNYFESNRSAFITGHLPGEANISALTYNVCTDTAVPQNVNVTQNGSSFVVSWMPVKNATGYILERSYRYGTDPESEPVEIAGINVLGADATSFTDTNISYDTVYTYYLTAYNANNDDTLRRESAPPVKVSKKLTMEILYAPHTVQVVPGDDFADISWRCNDEKAVGFDIQYIRTDKLKEVAKNVKSNAISQLKTNHPEVDWATIENIESYISENLAGEYSEIYESLYDAAFTDNAKESSQRKEDVLVEGETDLFAYTLRNLTPDVSYTFRVRSYVLTADPSDPYNFVKRPASEYQPYPEGYSVVIRTPFNPPQGLKATTADGNITVTWNPVDTAAGYELEVRRYDNKSNLISKNIVTTTSTRYELQGLRAGDIYIFRVRATKRVSGLDEPKRSDYSAPAYAIVGNPIIKVTDLKAVLEGNNVKVTWNAAAGEFTGYYLYITCDGITTRKDLTTNEYIHTDVLYGKTYSYYVIPFRSTILSDGTVQYYEGDRSNTETITVGGSIAFPTDLKATQDNSQVMLDWSDVEGAEGYIVYATCDGKTDKFNVKNSEFLHTGIIPGKEYSYYVVAYKTMNGSVVYSNPSNTIKAVAGGFVTTPIDFNVTTNETTAILSWTAVDEVNGYTVYGVSDRGDKLEIDVSQNTYVHRGLLEGDSWSYYVRAYKLINNQKLYSGSTNTITVKIGASFPPPNDLVATPGNRSVVLQWTPSDDDNVDGYIVYVYDENTGDFQPLSIVSNNGTYTHTGLKNGKKYTYMVAAYRFVNGKRVIGDYSLAVTAIPSSGNAADVDYTIDVKGTAPYGISHSELISAAANHEAFNDPVEAYFSVNDESTRAVKEVLRNYANGLKSFIVYPFDISLYLEDTLVEVEPNEGFNITFTIPVPDVMKSYRDYITVVHLKNDGTDVIEDTNADNIFVQSTDLEVLPSAIVDVGGVWCVQFTTASCSPFAFVVYKDNLDDVKSGSSTAGSGGYSGSFDTGVLLFTALPDILPAQRRTKLVERTKKRYRIKKNTKQL